MLQRTLPGLPEDARKAAQVARLVSFVVTQRRGDLTAKAIAIECGMMEEEVRAVLTDPMFKDVMTQRASMIAATSVARGMAVMDEIVQDSKASPMTKVAAFRAVMQAHVELGKTKAKNPIQEARGALEAVIKDLNPMSEGGEREGGR